MHPLISVVLSLLLVCLLQRASSAESIDGFILSGTTFSLKTSVTKLFPKQTGDRAVHFEESYSAEQRRAKIEVQYQNLESRVGLGEFVYDATSKVQVSYDKISKKCQDKSIQDVYDTYLPVSSKMKQLLLSIHAPEHDHVVGPARLLYYLASMRDRMEEPKGFRSIQIRNHKATDMLLKATDEVNATIYVFYEASIPKNKDSFLSQIPLKASVELAENNEIVELDFYDLRIGQISLRPLTWQFPNRDDDVRWDNFVFPLTRGCSEIAPNYAKQDLFRLPFTGIQLSFNARSDNDSSYFVAFNGPLSSIRVDTLLRNQYSTIKLMDLSRNEKFTIKNHDHNEAPPTSYRDPEMIQCAVTRAMVDSKYRVETGYSISNFLLGSDRFVYMGRAVVRGSSALIYEVHQARLPIWLGQPTIYKTYRFYKAGTEKARQQNDIVTEFAGEDQKDEYSMLIYLAEERGAANDTSSIDWNRLLMIELYKSSEDDRLQLSIQIYGFLWKLSDAPNGDKAHELFEFHEACLTRGGTSRYAEIEFSLVGNLMNASWIYEKHDRQTAVSAIVKETFAGPSFMSYDLNSKVTSYQTDPEAESSLRATFRLVEHPQVVYEFTFESNARLKPNVGSLTRRDVVRAQDPSDCLWLMRANQKISFVLFSDVDKTCISDGSLGNKSNSSDSDMFEFSTDYEGEFYKIQAIEEKPDRDELETKIKHVENFLVALRSPLSPETAYQAIYKLRIKQVKLKAVNYLQHTLVDGDKFIGTIYQGFSLIELSSGLTSRYNAQTLLAEGQTLSLGQCEAACLGDLECKSFSFCTGWPEASCFLTRIPFNTAKVARQLNSPESRKLRQGDKLQVKIEGFGDVELKRDPRCELHNKLYLTMFDHGWPLVASIADATVVAATDEEDCARECFARSLESIKANIALSRKIEELSGKGDNTDELERELQNRSMKHASFASGFCTNFYYIGSSLEEEQYKQLNLLAGKESSLESGGAFCIWLNKTPGWQTKIKTEAPDKLDKLDFKLETYRFDMASLYEKQMGVMMVDSNRTEQEIEAYGEYNSNPNPEGYELFKRAAEEGRNFQQTFEFIDAGLCAYRCLFQMSAPLPSCQSFDFIISTDFRSTCRLNSLSITSVSRAYTETISKDKQLMIHHYEPRIGIIKEKLDLDRKTSYWLDIDQSNRSNGETVWTRPMITWLIVILASACGFFFGLKLVGILDAKFGIYNQANVSPIAFPDLIDDISQLDETELADRRSRA